MYIYIYIYIYLHIHAYIRTYMYTHTLLASIYGAIMFEIAKRDHSLFYSILSKGGGGGGGDTICM